MADQSDVETAIAGVVGGALYPNGVQQPCAAAGQVVRIYRGFPVPAALDADLAAGWCNVSVVAVPGQEANTTRWLQTSLCQPILAPQLTVQVTGQTVTFGGIAAPGQVAAVIADQATAAHRTQAGDSPASVAAALAAGLAPRAASASGAVLTVPSAIRLVARVEADQPVLRLTRQQSQRFAVTCWCPDPRSRDLVASAIDAALSAITFIGLADGTSGRLRALASEATDRWETATLYRRELIYAVDYATTVPAVLPRMAVGIATQSPAGQAVLS